MLQLKFGQFFLESNLAALQTSPLPFFSFSDPKRITIHFKRFQNDPPSSSPSSGNVGLERVQIFRALAGFEPWEIWASFRHEPTQLSKSTLNPFSSWSSILGARWSLVPTCSLGPSSSSLDSLHLFPRLCLHLEMKRNVNNNKKWRSYKSNNGPWDTFGIKSEVIFSRTTTFLPQQSSGEGVKMNLWTSS